MDCIGDGERTIRSLEELQTFWFVQDRAYVILHPVASITEPAMPSAWNKSADTS